MWGVLVAISIPIFTSQLEKSRDAVTESNVRAAYAQAQTAWLTAGVGKTTVDGMTVTKAEGDTGSVEVPGVKIMGQQANGGFDPWPYSFKAGENAATGLDSQTNHTGTKITFSYGTAGAEPTITVG
ncbi:hypothetical protein [Oribacterium sp. Sow4_G1_1]|uniref:hypothetical protein n=1 Tax=Oribacterium sp. Sow4_G1_1 TaxID=3438794 RepID=UPI003F9D4C3E